MVRKKSFSIWSDIRRIVPLWFHIMKKEASVSDYGCLNLLLFCISVVSALVHAVISTSVQLQTGCCWWERRERGGQKENKNVKNVFVKYKWICETKAATVWEGGGIKVTIFFSFWTKLLPVFTHWHIIPGPD